MLNDRDVRQVFYILSTQEMIDERSIGDDLGEARWSPRIVKWLREHDVVISPYEYAAIILWTRRQDGITRGPKPFGKR